MKTILFSTTAHESPECLQQLWDNIQWACGENYRPILLVHASPEFYAMRGAVSREIMWHPKPFKKERFTHTLYWAHVCNANYAQNEAISHDYFCTIASNCLFVRQLPKAMYVPRELPTPLAPGFSVPDPEKWTYAEFMKNPKLVRNFKLLGMAVKVAMHEGAVYGRFEFHKMAVMGGVHFGPSKFDHEIAAEEIILPSIEFAVQGKMSKRLCVWIPGMRIEDVESIQETGSCKSAGGRGDFYMVKVQRLPENEVRGYIMGTTVGRSRGGAQP